MLDHLLPSTQAFARRSSTQRLCKLLNSFLVLSSDDDDDKAANEDLSLKIVEKALLMHVAKLVLDAAVDNDGDAGVSNGTQGAIDGSGN